MLQHHRENLSGNDDRINTLASDEFTDSLEKLVERFSKSSILSLAEIRVW
jgi:hypothetical protein